MSRSDPVRAALSRREFAFESIGGAPGELAARVASESRTYAAVVEDAQIAVD